MSVPGASKSGPESTVATRVSRLKDLAGLDLQVAQDAAWGWFERVGKQLPSPAAQDELDELFTLGVPAAALDGQTDGALLGWASRDPSLTLIAKALYAVSTTLITRLGILPWRGKRFDAATKKGTNSVSLLALALAPLTPLRSVCRAGDHWEAFPMNNWVEPSRLDSGTEVLVADYASVKGNRWPVSRISDELVEIVPGTYLGKMLWNQGDDHYLLNYFALKSPVQG